MSGPPQHSADAALARAASDGDADARERLFRRLECVPRFLATLNRRAGRPLDEQSLEDLAQHVLMLVWSKLAEYRGDAALESWTFRFCALQMLNAVRKAARRGHGQQRAGAEDPRPEQLGVMMPVDRGLVLEEMETLLACLAPRETEVLRLRLLEDQTLPEIAETLKISVSSTKTHYYRGLEKLRSRLAPTQGELP